MANTRFMHKNYFSDPTVLAEDEKILRRCFSIEVDRLGSCLFLRLEEEGELSLKEVLAVEELSIDALARFNGVMACLPAVVANLL